MSRRLAGTILFGAVLVVLAAVILMRSPGGEAIAPGDPQNDTDDAQETFQASLFYPGPGGLLREHLVDLPQPTISSTETVPPRESPRMRAVLERYLAGPPPEGTMLAFPEGTSVQSIDRAAGGVVFVSLSLPEGAALQVGSRAELLMVYGLVNSLAYSLPEVERVALLWTGVQPATFAGHVDTTQPLLPSRKWVKSADAEPNS